ncbi:Dyp-type peroxidase [Kocuria palustris]|uniref:Dyp-type peroxidase n=1 Tax=Kocuria palustris TaxID=71999 RepID=UPI002468FF02|nr:Dyp-type peroxidase [Kocuria palustris]MDH5150755.1 Dyp-type peroxidase [Kocuria palustris]
MRDKFDPEGPNATPRRPPCRCSRSSPRSVSFRRPDDSLQAVAGIGARLWDRLWDLPLPKALHPFEEVQGARHRAPSTPGDLLLHLRAKNMDVCCELASMVMDRLCGHAEVVGETHGFKFFDQRDLLGSVDGSENPEGQTGQGWGSIDAAEDPDYAGAGYVIVQKYLHDMQAWNALRVEHQDDAIGRTKTENIELPDDRKPKNSHVHLNSITDDDGRDLKIVRDNRPFGTIGTAGSGTYFIGDTKGPAIIERMLRNMFVGEPEGTTDRVLDFSTATTGSLFFVPTAAFLDDDQPAAGR